MAVRKVTCVFNNVNGENTGAYCRTGMSKSTSSPGILIKKNCPNGTFYVDGNDGGTNQYYKLINPSSYGLPNKPMYAFCDKSFLSKMDWASETKPAPEPASKKKDPTVKNESSFKYSQGLDDAITAMLQKNTGIKDIMDNVRVFGAPYKFLKTTDYQPFLPEIELGRKYLENILAEAPIVYFVPGIPSYLPDFDKQNKEILEQYIASRYSGQEVSDVVANKILKEEGRYFDFIANYADYMRYVNLLCRVCSVYMGISEKNVPGTTEKYKEYDWSRYINQKAKPSSEKIGLWRLKEEAFDFVEEEIFGSYKYLKCYVDPNASFSESASNNTTQSMFAGLFDTIEGLGKDIAFLTGGDGKSALESIGGTVSKVTSSGRNAFDNKQTSNITKLLGLTEHVITGSNIIFPEIWGDAAYNKSYQFTINLVSPYGDIESVYLNIIVPMMHLIGLGLPRQTSANSFTSPFLVKVFCKGWFSCEMGMVDSISIEKVNENYNVNGLPNEVKVTLSVKDLYSNLMITKSSKPQLFFNNQGLIDFLAVTCGVDITKPNIASKLEAIISTFLNTLYDIPSNYYNSFIQAIRNRIEPLFKITR